MRILVDADACPVKDIIVRLARQRGCHGAAGRRALGQHQKTLGRG